MPAVEFWFEFASTYSYPAAMRIQGAAEAVGVCVVWRPFLLGPIFAEQGWNDSPFNLYPAKGRYMWRDMERVCLAGGLPLRRPTVFPRNGLAAARVAMAGVGQPWIGAFVRGVYHANFVEDRDIADADVVRAILVDIGCDATAVMAESACDTNKLALRSNTEHAAEAGIFGAPSFCVDGELFWGNDRLEAALAHCVSLSA